MPYKKNYFHGNLSIFHSSNIKHCSSVTIFYRRFCISLHRKQAKASYTFKVVQVSCRRMFFFSILPWFGFRSLSLRWFLQWSRRPLSVDVYPAQQIGKCNTYSKASLSVGAATEKIETRFTYNVIVRLHDCKSVGRQSTRDHFIPNRRPS